MVDEVCPNCKQPRPGGSSGSLTQWIFVCNCASLQMPASDKDSDSHRFQICRKCRKRVSSGRDGSLTQFVFRSDSCRCECPEVLDVAVARPSLPADATPFNYAESFGEDVDALDLPPDSFPTDRFAPLRELGRGASGAVYLCIDKLLGTKVAVKTLHLLSADQLLSFQQEARAISRLTHPNIVRILDFGAIESGIPYMVLEYINGADLESFAANRGGLDLNETIDIVTSICDALSYAHSKQIFHRDLKPSNILIVKSGLKLKAKLVDFGVARVKFETSTPTVMEGTSVIGTPAYMSPDQMRGISFDQRSEVYSLGCILFELLTGRQIYSGETVMEVVSQHVNSPIPLLKDVAPDDAYAPRLDNILQRCLAKKPEDRYQNMAELKNDLLQLLEEEHDTQPDGTVPNSGGENESTASSAGVSGTEYSEALKSAIRNKSIDSSSPAERLKKSTFSPAAVAVILAFAVLVTAAVFVSQMKLDPKSKEEEAKNAEKSAQDAASLNNSLVDSRYQINEFDGNHWTFNMGEVSDKSLDELFHPKDKDDSRRLWFDSGYISPAGILKLKPLGVLAFAIINLELTEEHLHSLARLKTIKALRLFENPGFGDKHLAIVSGMNNLNELFIRNSGVSDKGVANLVALTNLKYLSLDRCRYLTDKSLDSIEKMTNLERLSVTETAISLEGVHRIARMKNLKTICISHLPCDSACIKELAALNPERLGLRYAPLTQEDIVLLSGVKSLKLLDVRDTNVNKQLEALFYSKRAQKGLPYCQMLRMRRSGINGFGEMVYETLDDEHMWTDSLRPEI